MQHDYPLAGVNCLRLYSIDCLIQAKVVVFTLQNYRKNIEIGAEVKAMLAVYPPLSLIGHQAQCATTQTIFS